jgi:hypothetical protein
MKEMLSCCGLHCHDCGAYIATMTDDDAKREEVAKEWSTMYNADLKASDINCTGCLSDGPNLFSHTKTCEIRKCARERGHLNCEGEGRAVRYGARAAPTRFRSRRGSGAIRARALMWGATGGSARAG